MRLEPAAPRSRVKHSTTALPVRVCNCSLFCCTLLYVHSCIAIILMGKRKLVALLILSSWFLVTRMVEWLFLAVPWGCRRFVIVVFPDHTHYYFWAKHLPFAPKNILKIKHLKNIRNFCHPKISSFNK